MKQIKNQKFFYLYTHSTLNAMEIRAKLEDKVINLTLVDVFNHKSNIELF